MAKNKSILEIDSKPPVQTHFTPTIKMDEKILLSVRSFSIVKSEQLAYQFLITLSLPHDGELNPNKLSTDNNATVLSFDFLKHNEEYRGKWVNFAIKWQENESPLLQLFWVGTRVK